MSFLMYALAWSFSLLPTIGLPFPLTVAGPNAQFPSSFPEELTTNTLVHGKFKIHCFLRKDDSNPEEPIQFRKDFTLECKKTDFGGKTWKLIDAKTLKIGNAVFTPDRTRTILEGRIDNKQFGYLFPDVPGLKILNPKQAGGEVFRHIFKTRKGFAAEWSLRTMLRFNCSWDLGNFACQGDPLWQVHLNSMMRFPGTITVYWVNARTGEVQQVFAKSEKAAP